MTDRKLTRCSDGRPFLSMVMIVKNEAKNIERCLDSFWSDCEECVICDTGITDGTVAAVRAYAKRKRETRKLKIGHFDWNDSFADARNYADSLATGDWRSWVDADDTVVGLPHLRQMAEEVDDSVAMIYCRYDYA